MTGQLTCALEVRSLGRGQGPTLARCKISIQICGQAPAGGLHNLIWDLPADCNVTGRGAIVQEQQC